MRLSHVLEDEELDFDEMQSPNSKMRLSRSVTDEDCKNFEEFGLEPRNSYLNNTLDHGAPMSHYLQSMGALGDEDSNLRGTMASTTSTKQFGIRGLRRKKGIMGEETKQSGCCKPG